ncbi:MAG: hypothetical protein NVS2B15_11850 [Pseudarthrobacter sp.]
MQHHGLAQGDQENGCCLYGEDAQSAAGKESRPEDGNESEKGKEHREGAGSEPQVSWPTNGGGFLVHDSRSFGGLLKKGLF